MRSRYKSWIAFVGLHRFSHLLRRLKHIRQLAPAGLIHG